MLIGGRKARYLAGWAARSGRSGDNRLFLLESVRDGSREGRGECANLYCTDISIFLGARGFDDIAAGDGRDVGGTLRGRFGLGVGVRALLKMPWQFLFHGRGRNFGSGRRGGAIGVGSSGRFGKEAQDALLLARRHGAGLFRCRHGPRGGASRGGRFLAHDDGLDGWRREVVESKYVSVQMLVRMVVLQSQRHIQFRARCGRQRVLERGGSGPQPGHFKGATGDARRARMEVASSASGQKSGACAKFRECGSPGSGPWGAVIHSVGKHFNSALENLKSLLRSLFSLPCV